MAVSFKEGNEVHDVHAKHRADEAIHKLSDGLYFLELSHEPIDREVQEPPRSEREAFLQVQLPHH